MMKCKCSLMTVSEVTFLFLKGYGENARYETQNFVFLMVDAMSSITHKDINLPFKTELQAVVVLCHIYAQVIVKKWKGSCHSQHKK